MQPVNGHVTMATLVLDGETVPFSEGETLYEIAARRRREVPTLCYDPRLEPFGTCRLCAVEVEGIRNPVASCTTTAQPGMVVRTTTEKLEKQRRILLEMVALGEPRNRRRSPARLRLAGAAHSGGAL